jgi:molybdopterin-guanine dinucleotide biosynthesis protein A
MYAIVTAGGIPQLGEPLYPYTQGQSKALLDIAGKPMIQWVLDALSGASTIEHVIIMGLSSEVGLTCLKPLTFIANQGEMLMNILVGVKKVLELSPEQSHALIVSSDIPAITAEMVDWVNKTALATDHDAYYNVILRSVMEARFPGSKRTYTRLKDAEVCGGDMNVVRTLTVTGKDELWARIIDSRKNAFKQASLLGFDLLFLLLIRQITIAKAEQKVSQRVGLKGKVVVCPYAEVGMDVDKPFQLELMRADLAKRVKA